MDNPERMVFVPREHILEVIGDCPSAQWRLLFALARFAGLRIPSDLVNLKIEDVNWEKGFIWIQSEKTRHYAHKGIRRVPLTPELQPFLLQAIENLEDGEVHLLPTFRTRSNLRTEAHRIIKRAGLEPWQKTFQNLRASLETEWMDKYGLRRACKWIGNTPAVAMKHYAIMRDEDFMEAGDLAIPSPAIRGHRGGHEGGQSVHDRPNLELTRVPAKSGSCTPVESCHKETPDRLGSQGSRLRPRGLEPPTSCSGGRHSIH